jgi:hypothetical protein
VSGAPLECQAPDQCHNQGTCSPATGICTDPPKVNGAPCDDGNMCTQTDTCQAGICIGGNPVVCGVLSQCTNAAACSPATGLCSDARKPNGTPCDDGDLCTQSDTCQDGICTGADPIVCAAAGRAISPAPSSCHGSVSDSAVPDGSPCDDGDLCTQTDT